MNTDQTIQTCIMFALALLSVFAFILFTI